MTIKVKIKLPKSKGQSKEQSNRLGGAFSGELERILPLILSSVSISGEPLITDEPLTGCNCKGCKLRRKLRDQIEDEEREAGEHKGDGVNKG